MHIYLLERSPVEPNKRLTSRTKMQKTFFLKAHNWWKGACKTPYYDDICTLKQSSEKGVDQLSHYSNHGIHIVFLVGGTQMDPCWILPCFCRLWLILRTHFCCGCEIVKGTPHFLRGNTLKGRHKSAPAQVRLTPKMWNKLMVAYALEK